MDEKRDLILTFCTQRQRLPNDVLNATWRRSPAKLWKKWHVIYFGQCHWLRGKNAREMLLRWKKRWQLFFGSDSVAISCHCKRSKIILVEVLTELCSLENIASWNWRKIAVAWSDSVLLHVEDMPKRWVIFTLFVYCMFRTTRYKKKL